MNWSPSQQEALSKFQTWYQSDHPLFALAGYAGTGKSTLQKEIVSSIPGTVILAAPTGKAAHRLAQVAGQDASTIHSLIYTPYRDKQTGELRFTYEDPQVSASLLIIDEASMVTDRMASDLADAFPRILYVGDPFQLPPVSSRDWFTPLRKDATLTEVHRQALDSPILRLATRLREGHQVGAADASPSNGLEVCPRQKIKSAALLQDYAQIITGKNQTRSQLIQAYRGKQPPLPLPGERVMCVNNITVGEHFLPNGEQGEVLATDYSNPVKPRLTFQAETSGHIFQDCLFHRGYFDHHYTPNIAKGFLPPPYSKENAHILHLDFASVITVHKSQGSQWDRVLLYDDGFLTWAPIEERRRWLYTGFTRASKSLTWAL